MVYGCILHTNYETVNLCSLKLDLISSEYAWPYKYRHRTYLCYANKFDQTSFHRKQLKRILTEMSAQLYLQYIIINDFVVGGEKGVSPKCSRYVLIK